jgi:hypothetical protein
MLGVLFTAAGPRLAVFAQNPHPKTPVYTKPELVAHFQNTAMQAFNEYHGAPDSSAVELLNQLLNHGADTIVEKKLFAKVEEADKNLWAFCARAVHYGVKPTKGLKTGSAFAAASPAVVAVTADSVRKARFDLCPLFPFC